MEENTILLLGNGVNRISNDYSWEDLLEDLIKFIGKESVINLKEEKPLTLLYEELVLRTKRFQNRKELELKKEISKLITQNFKPNIFHKQVLELIGIQHILTTNYDYNFEKAHNYEWGKVNLYPEKKYNMFRRRKIGNKYVWHIHGEAEVPNSISLGHEHYAGYIQKMRNYLTSGIPTKKKRINSPIFSSRPNHDYTIEDLEKKRGIYSWVDLFLGCNVHIVGLSLDYTEIDLWWLIIYKERMRYKSKYSGRIGKSTFHYFKQNEINTFEESKLSLLESYGVEIRKCPVKNNNYERAYNYVFQNFR